MNDLIADTVSDLLCYDWCLDFAVMAESLNLDPNHCLSISPHIFCPFFWIITYWPDNDSQFLIFLFTFAGYISE